MPKLPVPLGAPIRWGPLEIARLALETPEQEQAAVRRWRKTATGLRILLPMPPTKPEEPPNGS